MKDAKINEELNFYSQLIGRKITLSSDVASIAWRVSKTWLTVRGRDEGTMGWNLQALWPKYSFRMEHRD
jgi:hypothetical protein